jgi:hypothetical protein
MLAEELRAPARAGRTHASHASKEGNMGARAPIAVNDVVRRKGMPAMPDVEGITLAQVGCLEARLGDVALVRWIVSGETEAHWRNELEVVPVENLERADVPE